MLYNLKARCDSAFVFYILVIHSKTHVKLETPKFCSETLDKVECSTRNLKLGKLG